MRKASVNDMSISDMVRYMAIVQMSGGRVLVPLAGARKGTVGVT